MAKKAQTNRVVQCPRCQASTPYKSKPKQRRKKNRTLRCHQCGLALTPYLEAATPPNNIRPVLPSAPTSDDIPDPPATIEAPAIAEDNPYPIRKTPAKPALLPNLLYTTGSVILVIALIFQVVWPKKDSLLENPHIYPWAAKTSHYLNIDIPRYRNPSQIRIVSKDLSPLNKGQLKLTLVITNQAGLPQPLPALTLKLYTFNGDKLAQRNFNPSEYSPSIGLPLLMKINQPFEIRLSILAPSNNIPVGGFTIAIS